MNDCIFCKIIKRELPALVIDENDKMIVFLSLENHPLIVPKKHIKDIYELDEETGAEIMRKAIQVAKATKKALNPDGINLVQANEPAAHQDVFHFHLHIKPRWFNDKVQMHWEPVRVEENIRIETQEKIKQKL